MNRNKKPLPTKPFFTRFLEQQQLKEAGGGQIDTTLKHPSDSDEAGEDI